MKNNYRQEYHLMPETGFLNDPNGLCYYNGEYHIFHQYAPQGLSAQRGWGHYTTKDFVNYNIYGMVIYPDSVWDKNGSYSGSALIDDGEMELFYTGNVKQPGNHDYTLSGREQNLIYMSSKDGVNFSEKELLMTNDDYPEDCSCHVRDPKGMECQNIYQSGYMIVEGDELSEFVEFDRGFDFYAPQTFLAPDGRRIIIGWFGLPDVPYKNPTEETENWIHCLTIPRTLEFKDNKIWQEPIAELEKLRTDEISISLEQGKINVLPKVQCEALINFKDKTDSFDISIRKDINISLKDVVFTLKIGDSGKGRTERSCKVDKTDSVRIFSDTSSVEIFVNGEVFSSRIYEEKDNSEDFTVVLNSSSQGSDLAYYILRPFEITKIS